MLKSALIIGAALGTAAFVWYKTRDEDEEKEEVKEEKVEEKPVEEEKKEEPKEEKPVEEVKEEKKEEVKEVEEKADLLNEVSDTMILVYVLNPFCQSPVATLRHDGYRYDTEGNGRRGGV